MNGEELALVPYADLMNHNPYSNTYIDAQRSGLPLVSKVEEVAIYADRAYKKFEQVRHLIVFVINENIMMYVIIFIIVN